MSNFLLGKDIYYSIIIQFIGIYLNVIRLLIIPKVLNIYQLFWILNMI